MTTDIAIAEQVSWVLEATVKAGAKAELDTVIQDCIKATAEDPNAVNYEFYLADETLHVFERYTDSAATLAHLAWFGEHMVGRFMAAVDVTKLTVYGSPAADVRAALDAMGAVYLEPFGGFSR